MLVDPDRTSIAFEESTLLGIEGSALQRHRLPDMLGPVFRPNYSSSGITGRVWFGVLLDDFTELKRQSLVLIGCAPQ